MYIGRAFPSFETNASRVLGFDLTAFLTGDEIVEFMVPAMLLQSGSDPALAADPTARFTGKPIISDRAVRQGVIFNDPTEVLAGNVYALLLATTTSLIQTVTPWASFSLSPGYAVLPQIPDAPSAGAQIIVLPAPGPKYTIPTLGAYAGQDFPAAVQGETLLYGFDFAPALSPDETILSVTAGLKVWSGSDLAVAASVSAYSAGGPVINGSVAQQMLAWPALLPQAGNVYILNMIAMTSFSQAISTWARISIGVV